MGRAGRCLLMVGLVVVTVASWAQRSVAEPRNSRKFLPEPFPYNLVRWEDFNLDHLATPRTVSPERRAKPVSVPSTPSPGVGKPPTEPEASSLQNFPDIPHYGTRIFRRSLAVERPKRSITGDGDFFLEGPSTYPEESAFNVGDGSDKSSNSVGQSVSSTIREDSNSESQGEPDLSGHSRPARFYIIKRIPIDNSKFPPEEGAGWHFDGGSGENPFSDEDLEDSGSGSHQENLFSDEDLEDSGSGSHQENPFSDEDLEDSGSGSHQENLFSDEDLEDSGSGSHQENPFSDEDLEDSGSGSHQENLFSDEDLEDSGSGSHEGSGGDQEDSDDDLEDSKDDPSGLRDEDGDDDPPKLHTVALIRRISIRKYYAKP